MAGFRPAGRGCGLNRSQSGGFAVGRQLRTDFAFGVSMATMDRVSKWPEKRGSSPFSEGSNGSPREAAGSPYQREGELNFTAVEESGRGPMAQFVSNRCHTPIRPTDPKEERNRYCSNDAIAAFDASMYEVEPVQVTLADIGRDASVSLGVSSGSPSISLAPPCVRSRINLSKALW